MSTEKASLVLSHESPLPQTASEINTDWYYNIANYYHTKHKQ